MPAAQQTQLHRCEWCLNDALYQRYHDTEWGQPCFDDRTLFEFLLLESAQAGLAWITVLRKRDHYRSALHQFDPQQVAQMDQQQKQRLLNNSGIIRNRLKIDSAINNAQCFIEIQATHGSFANYLWAFVDGQPLQNQWKHIQQVPPHSPLSDKISKEMKQRGFQFFGKTICYAYMQAIGMVNDHTITCFRHRECQTGKG